MEPLKELEAEGQDWVGRAWDMLTILRHAVRGAIRSDEVHFAPLFSREPGRQPMPIKMWAQCGPGDNAEPVITILLEGEN